MSALLASRPKAVTLNVRERTRGWLNPLNLHWAGVGFLSLVIVYLLIHMAFAYQQAKSRDADALARQQVALKTAEIAERPLEGLDTKLQSASASADRFYLERLPVSYSEFLTELGALAKRQNIRLTHVNYAPSPVAGDAAGQLTQVNMDASLSGDYRTLVVFLNGLERDKLFFLITGVALSGQQTGVVNLRIKLTTYLRGTHSQDEIQRALGPPETANAAPANASTALSGGAQ